MNVLVKGIRQNGPVFMSFIRDESIKYLGSVLVGCWSKSKDQILKQKQLLSPNVQPDYDFND